MSSRSSSTSLQAHVFCKPQHFTVIPNIRRIDCCMDNIRSSTSWYNGENLSEVTTKDNNLTSKYIVTRRCTPTHDIFQGFIKRLKAKFVSHRSFIPYN